MLVDAEYIYTDTLFKLLSAETFRQMERVEEK
jgi:hypothetical protein